MEIVTSSIFPTCLIIGQSASSRTIGVGLRLSRPRVSIVVDVITLITTPRSTKTFEISTPLIWTVTIGFHGSPYLTGIIFPNIMSHKFPMTWIVGGSFGFLPGFLEHNSLIILVYIDTSFIAWSNGILTNKFCSSPKRSNSS